MRRNTEHRPTRTVALVLTLALTWNGLAHAAKPSRSIALAQAAAQQSQAQPQQAPATDVRTPDAGIPGSQPTQTAAATPAAATPALGARERLLGVHTIFLAEPSNDAHFALSETDTYNTVLNALNKWGRYRVVPDAAQADLLLQVHGVTTTGTTAPDAADPAGSLYYISNLRLTVADPHTLSPLWVASTPAATGLRRSKKADRLAVSGENLVSQLKLLVGDPLSPGERAALKAAQPSHRVLVIVIVAGIASTLAIFFIARHFMKQNASNFCQAHGLTPCPGA